MFPSVICALEQTRNLLSCGPWGRARRACLETTTNEEGPEGASGEDAKIYDAEVRDERLHRPVNGGGPPLPCEGAWAAPAVLQTVATKWNVIAACFRAKSACPRR